MDSSRIEIKGKEERFPGELGRLVLSEDGAVLTSSGELENDEKTGNIIMGLITMPYQVDPLAFPPGDSRFQKLTITYDDHCYIVCMSNRKVHIVKRTLNIPDSLAISA